MKKNIESKSSVSRLSDEGQKEGFQTLHKTSENTAKVDSDAINNIGSLTSEYISASKEALANAKTEDERTQRLKDARDALREAREDIREVNKRSHQSQRGFSTLAIIGMTALAGVAISGGLWLLSKK
ncbi:hypothetical protein [Zobellella iuensis]|uniref:DUF883 domain-containing protein n=1 Tax=Zobellella iuensis TaxID=2803811 RepID=A0ABS1QN06_9GAMM|nr:hypothetical protein [Zobellella iuensis]MBL1376191.1 hypothetical protein [Zobellella iuensis]